MIRFRSVLPRGFILVLAVGTWFSQLRPPPPPDTTVRLGMLPNAQLLRIIGRSQLEFVADLFWVRMANMGGRAQTSDEYAALLPLGHLIADLSPKFQYPYYLGGTLAPFRHFPSHHYDHAEEAIALMARGTAAVPSYVRLHVVKAYSEMEMLGDKQAAARTLMAAARAPNAPPYIAALATRLLADQGQFDDATKFAEELAKSDDPDVRAEFERRLLQISLERVLVQVDQAVAQFIAREGRSPSSVHELVEKGDLSGLPHDPFGGEIELTPEGARSTVETSRLKAYIPLE